MSREYREHRDSREAFDAHQPTAADWADYAAWLDATEPKAEPVRMAPSTRDRNRKPAAA